MSVLLVLIMIFQIGPVQSVLATPVNHHQDDKTRIIIDYENEEVAIPVTVNRIISSLPAFENICLLLGAKEKVVAIMPFEASNLWVKKIFPEVTDLPQVFKTPNLANLEELMNLQPDVVLVGNPALKKEYEVAEIAAPYIMFTTAEELMWAIRTIGSILGEKESEKAEKLVELYNGNIDFVANRIQDVPLEERPTIYYAANSLLNTEGANTIISTWIENSGATNVAAINGVEGSFKDISAEDLVAWDPDIIVLRDFAHLEQVKSDERFQTLSAVVNDRVYVSPKGIFVWATGAGIIMQTMWQAKVNYPDLFTDINVEDLAREFYHEYYGYDLSDEEIDLMLNPTE